MTTAEKFRQQIDSLGIRLDTMEVNIVSAEAEIFSGRAKVLVVSGQEGELGIYPGHTPLLTAIKPGQVKLVSLQGEEQFYYVSGGFLEVQPDVATILADTVIRAEEIDEAEAKEAVEKAKKTLEAHKKLDNYQAIEIELSKALAQLRVARRGRRYR